MPIRTPLTLFVAMVILPAIRAETPSAADVQARIAKLTPAAARDERLAGVKWLAANSSSAHAPRAIPALEERARNDPDPTVRRQAVAALVRIVNRHDVPCPLGLIVALTDPVDEVRWEAAVLEGPYQRRLAPGVFEALLAAAADTRADVRSTALLLLAIAAAKEPKARAVIEKAKADKDFEVRLTAHSAWLRATDDLAAFLACAIRVREEPKAMLDALPQGSKEAEHQQRQRNLFLIGTAGRILGWTEDRPDDLAAALLKLLENDSAPIRRGAVDLMGASARQVENGPKEGFGTPPRGQGLESLLPYLDPEVPVSKEKPAAPPQASKAYASLLARDADAKLRELAAKDPDETVRAAARRALDRWRDVPVPRKAGPRDGQR